MRRAFGREHAREQHEAGDLHEIEFCFRMALEEGLERGARDAFCAADRDVRMEGPQVRFEPVLREALGGS